ncbi:MAG TPA: SRPBCC domain-containing protein [Candidatus Kapabacteria bacterium]|nr:SRPBCC domain-containing protein [Candidatus Kapabacteria bacterium]
MENSIFIKNSIQIDAPAAKVWDALINPDKTKLYMFGCEAISDWKLGSDLNWKCIVNGKAMVVVIGKVVSFEPMKRLIYTVFDPNSNMENIPENYLTVTYLLEEIEGKTYLRVSQGDYSKVAEGERRYKEAYNNGEGWNPILLQIKGLVEGK